MEKPMVRCRCGHSVLGKEVLRTDLYERSSGAEYVYVKFRCARCKRIAQTFVPASAWDWRKLEPSPNELLPEERDRLLEEEPVEAADLLLFHDDMARIETAAELASRLRLEELTPFSFEPTGAGHEAAGSERARPRRRTRGRRERDDKRAAKDKGRDKGKKDSDRAGEAGHHEAGHHEAPHSPRDEGPH